MSSARTLTRRQRVLNPVDLSVVGNIIYLDLVCRCGDAPRVVTYPMCNVIRVDGVLKAERNVL